MTCANGYLDCDSRPAGTNQDGCETPPTLTNCGACGNACSTANAVGVACTVDTCTHTSCANGYLDCVQTSHDADGCETAPSLSNCGACGTACTNTGGTTSCTYNGITGGCVPVCDSTHSNCDGNINNGCEATSDLSHCGGLGCGACDTLWSNPTACTNNVCLYTCKAGYLDCNKTGADLDGCETFEDANHCGASCMACASLPHTTSPACKSSTCGYAACTAGFSDCDSNVSNGCETNTDGDINNCGACGHVCPRPANGAPTCIAGMCGASCIQDAGEALKVCVTDAGADNCFQCCVDSDCTSPPDKCHVPVGACVSGFCQYDTKTCTQVDCYSTPMCNSITGNCDSVRLTGGSCGGTMCYTNQTAGTCMSGQCVDGNGNPLQLASCTSNVPCKVGVCDKTGNCAAEDAPNGAACTSSDLCQLNPSCFNGMCVGAAKQCATAKLCHVAVCNSSTGSCDENIAVMGTMCSTGDPCRQNEQCDVSGNCVGTPKPDGNPCQLADCMTGGVCVSGTCSCAANLDMSMSTTVGDMAQRDGSGGGSTGGKGNGKHGGCDVAGPAEPAGAALLLLMVAVLWLGRRRARR
jgi:MYXO-CTERM domain-containing protein